MNHENCHQLLSSLSEYVDGTLDDSLCMEISRHVADCENCRIVLDTLRKTISLYQSSSQQVEIPEGVRDRLFQRLNLDDYVR